ncbi:MAG: hypothetical protein COV46_07785 [Deltaproteobacteria bacterium CG11_big_fil_rev_8_21_14_0_20_49_13]|nr:MAG: hypothetical protein COV46_07785 [Deltaproteobacteria bacterium CG11_big_fil_rev_8_21_14_0_20_49_13]
MPKRLFSPKVEDALRKGVVAVGNVVEGLIGKAEKLGAGFKSSSSMSVQAVLSLEGQIPLPKLKEILCQVSDKVIEPFVPSLVDKTALEVREGASTIAKFFKEKGASVSVHVDMGGSAGSYGKPGAGISSIRSVSSKLPFEDGFFDLVAGNYANQFQGDLLKNVKELSRVMAITGEGVIVDFHPFGLYARRGNVRIKPISSVTKGIEDYYKLCKMASLKITGAKESFFDETARPYFVTEEEKSAFRIIKDTPMLIYLFVKKGAT